MTIQSSCDYNQKRLEQVIACNKSTLSSILDTMEKNKLIVRYEDEHDSRRKLVKLTDKALDIIKAIEGEIASVDNYIHVIVGDDYDLFCNCLNKIYSNLKEEL